MVGSGMRPTLTPSPFSCSGRGGPSSRGMPGCPSVESLPPMVTVLMPLPATDFDPTEVAVTWQLLTAAGHSVVFATPSGQPGRADDIMVTGRGLDPWGAIPGVRRLTVVGHVLRANADAPTRLRRVGGRRRLRLAAALGCSPAQRLRRTRVTRWHRRAGCGPTWRAPKCSRSPSTRSGPASRWAPSATACS